MVSVGNPFMLLKTESHMIMKYGEKGKCWSQYLKTCLDHDTLSIHSSVRLSSTEQQACIEKLKRLVEERLAIVKSPSHAEVNQAHKRSQEDLPISTMATAVTIPKSNGLCLLLFVAFNIIFFPVAAPTQPTEDTPPEGIPDQARTKVSHHI